MCSLDASASSLATRIFGRFQAFQEHFVLQPYVPTHDLACLHYLYIIISGLDL